MAIDMRIAPLVFFVIVRQYAVVLQQHVVCIRVTQKFRNSKKREHASELYSEEGTGSEARSQDDARSARIAKDEKAFMTGELDKPSAGQSRWYDACHDGRYIHRFRESSERGGLWDNCKNRNPPSRQCPGSSSMFCYDEPGDGEDEWCCCSLNDIGISGWWPSKKTTETCGPRYLQAKEFQETQEKYLSDIQSVATAGSRNASLDGIIHEFLDGCRNSVDQEQVVWDTLDKMWKKHWLCTLSYLIGNMSGPSLLDVIRKQANSSDEFRETLLAGYELQMNLHSLKIPAAFSSISIMGMFRLTWYAALYTSKRPTPPYEPLPGDFKFPFIPRLLTVLAMEVLKPKMRRRNPEKGEPEQAFLETINLMSASPRIDDCVNGEAFIAYHSWKGQSSGVSHVVKEDPKVRLINQSMMVDTMKFLNSAVDLSQQEKVGTALWELWERISKRFKQKDSPWFSVMTVLAAYGTDEQVGHGFYASYDYGAPEFFDKMDTRSHLLSMVASRETVIPHTPHQFRFRPYSAEEIISAQVRPSNGANGLVGFRFSTQGQRDFWDETYDEMLNVAAMLIVK